MILKLTVIASVLFAATFGFLILTAKTLFDAAWMIAILSIPASTAADVVSRLLAGWFGNGHKNVLVDLAMLFIFGLAQYGLLGCIVGWVIDQTRKAQ
jgi:hypothetical protein